MGELGFWRHAAAAPEHVALIGPDETPIRAGDLLASCNRLVHALRAQGVQTGDTIAAVMGNEPAFLELYLAAAQAGYYLVPINHHFVAAEIAYILRDSEAKALFISEPMADVARAAAQEAGLLESARFCTAEAACPGFRSYRAFKEEQPTHAPDDRRPGSVMNYTSGTTGKPKGVRRPLPSVDPDTMGEQLGMFLLLFGLTPGGNHVHLCGSPLYHTAVLNFATYSLHLGHTVAVMDKWTPQEHLRWVQEHRVTHTHMVPTQFSRLLALPQEVKERYDTRSLTHAIHSAAPCPVDIKRRMLAWWGPTIYEYYAASEGGGTLATPTQWQERPGTVGRPWPISEIKILRDDGSELPAGEVGTVYMRMARFSFEYHGDRIKTERAFKSDGFFTVGDAGYVDDAGFLFLRDRKIDMIISGGANIYPAEIESVLVGHPWVGDVAVFGIPHDDWGEEVRAAVELCEGMQATATTERELLEYCQRHLAKFKCPKRIDFVTQMPRDPNGKLYKRKLRDPYWAGRERLI